MTSRQAVRTSEFYAVFQTADQVFDLARSDLGGGEIERRLVSERGMRSREPPLRLLEITLEELQGETDQSRQAHESIRLLRLKLPRFLPPRECPCRDLKQFCKARSAQTQNAPELFEGFIGQAFAHALVKLRRIIGAQAQA